MVEDAVSALGGLDVLCTNAGVYPEQRIEALREEDVDALLATNLKGTMFSVQAAARHLAVSGRGRVVVTSSITGPTTGYPGLSGYASTKAAQLGFVRTAALELAGHGITVNAVLPGAVRTEGLAALGNGAITSMTRAIPAGRLGEPDDIGAAALFLSSRSAGFVTGQAITVDGGQTLPEFADQI
jgi:3-oxoacyl-[acyl-carrier protein] reductase